MKNVTQYINNLGKSITYSAVDALKKQAPSTTEMVTTNAELFKEIRYAIVNKKQIFRRADDIIKSSKVYEALGETKKSLFEDLKTGNFYNKSRIEAMNAKAMGMDDMGMGDIPDMNFDDSDMGMDWGDEDLDLDLSDGDIVTVEAIESTSKSSSAMISNAVAKSSDYIVQSNKTVQKINMIQNMELVNGINSNIKSLNESLVNATNSIGETLATHAQNSKTFFEEVSKTSQESVALLKELVEMERNRYKIEQTDRTRKNLRYDDIVSSDGAVDIKQYFGQVLTNFKNKNSAITSMSAMFGEDSNILLTMAGSPLQFITEKIADKVIGETIKESIKTFDDTLSGAFGTLMARFNLMARDENPIMRFIGETFGMNTALKRDLDPSKYNKGPLPWDGKSKRSLEYVIPTYLSKILAALTGQQESVYDLEAGIFKTTRDIKNDFDAKKKNASESATNDVRTEMEDILKNVKRRNKEDQDQMNTDLSTFLDFFYSNGIMFDNRSKDFDFYKDLGLNIDSTNYDIFSSVFNNISRGAQTKFNHNIQTARADFTDMMNGLEDNGSIISKLFDGSDKVKVNETNNKGEITSQYGIAGLLTDSIDDRGKNIFWYLRNMYETLATGIRVFDISNDSRGPNRVRNNRRRINNVSETSDPILNSINNRNTVVTDDRPRTGRDYAAEQEKHEKEIQKRLEKAAENNDDIFILEDIMSEDSNVHNLMDARISMIQSNEQVRRDIEQANKPKTFIEKMLEASLPEKMQVLADNARDLLSKPRKMITDAINLADVRLYEVLYGTEEHTYRGQKVSGVMDRLMVDLKYTFEDFNEWLNEKILTPLTDKLDEYGGFTGIFNSMLEAIGIDPENNFFTNAKDYLFGKDSVFKEIGNNLKEDFKSVTGYVKDSIKSVYGEVDSKLNISGKFTDVKNKFNETTARFRTTEETEEETKIAEIPDINQTQTSTATQAINQYTNDEVNAIKQVANDTNLTVDAVTSITDSINSFDVGTPYVDKTQIAMIHEGEAVLTKEERPIWDKLKNVTIDPNAMVKLTGSIEKLTKTLENDEVDGIVSTKELTEEEVKKENDRYNSEVGKIYRDLYREYNKINKAIKRGDTDTLKKIMGDSYDDTEFEKVSSDISKDLESLKIQLGIEDDESLRKIMNGSSQSIGEKIKETSGFNEEQKEKISKLFGVEKYEDLQDLDPESLSKYIKNRTEKQFENLNNIDTTPKEKNKDSLVYRMGEEISSTMSMMKESLFGTSDTNQFTKSLHKATADIQENFREYFGKGASGGILGGAGALLFGMNPLLGASVGAAASIISRSEDFQNYLFGEKDEDGNHKGGFVSKDVIDTVKKYAPDVGKYGITGAAAALLIPGIGPLGGLMMGSGIGFLKNNQEFSEALFGEKTSVQDGLDKIKKKLPKLAIGAIGGAMLGPFGIVGNLMLGGAAGWLSDTTMFKEFMFGKRNPETGVFEGGILPAIRETMLKPFANWAKDIKTGMLKFLKEEIHKPLKYGFKALGREFKYIGKSIITGVSNAIGSVFEKIVGQPMKDFMEIKIFKPMARMFGGIGKFMINVAKNTIKAPVNLIAGAGNIAANKQLRRSGLEGMSEDEILYRYEKNPRKFLNNLNKSGLYDHIDPYQFQKQMEEMKANLEKNKPVSTDNESTDENPIYNQPNEVEIDSNDQLHRMNDTLIDLKAILSGEESDNEKADKDKQTVTALEDINNTLDGMKRNQEMPDSEDAMMPTEFGVVRYNRDANGNTTPINDSVYRDVMESKGAAAAMQQSLVDKLSFFSRTPEEVEQNKSLSLTDIVQKVTSGIGTFISSISKFLPIFAAIAAFFGEPESRRDADGEIIPNTDLAEPAVRGVAQNAKSIITKLPFNWAKNIKTTNAKANAALVKGVATVAKTGVTAPVKAVSAVGKAGITAAKEINEHGLKTAARHGVDAVVDGVSSKVGNAVNAVKSAPQKLTQLIQDRTQHVLANGAQDAATQMAAREVVSETAQEASERVARESLEQTSRNVARTASTEVAQSASSKVIDNFIKYAKETFIKVIDDIIGFCTKYFIKIDGKVKMKLLTLIMDLLNPKNLLKFVGKITKGMARVAGTAATLGLLDATFMVWGAVTGGSKSETANLFQISKDNVTWTMRIISGSMKALLNAPFMFVVDIANEVNKLVSGHDFIHNLSVWLYNLISSDNDEAELLNAQEQFNTDYEQYVFDNELEEFSKDAYNDKTNRSVTMQVYDKTKDAVVDVFKPKYEAPSTGARNAVEAAITGQSINTNSAMSSINTSMLAATNVAKSATNTANSNSMMSIHNAPKNTNNSNSMMSVANAPNNNITTSAPTMDQIKLLTSGYGGYTGGGTEEGMEGTELAKGESSPQNTAPTKLSFGDAYKALQEVTAIGTKMVANIFGLDINTESNTSSTSVSTDTSTYYPLQLDINGLVDMRLVDEQDAINRINAFFSTSNKLKNKGSNYWKGWLKYSFDPFLAAAITWQETGGNSNALNNYNNPGGYMDSKNNWMTLVKFNTIDDGIDAVISNLGKYGDRYDAHTIEEIGNIYCPVGADNDPNGYNKHWIPNVTKFYQQLTQGLGATQQQETASQAINSSTANVSSGMNVADFYKENGGFYVTSNYGARVDPFGSGKIVGHKGIDFGHKNKEGTPIGSTTDGKVVDVYKNLNKTTGYGHAVRIQDEAGKIHTYAHLQHATHLKEGDTVKTGELVGKMGTTGASTGPHLHYQINDDLNWSSTTYDPNAYISALNTEKAKVSTTKMANNLTNPVNMFNRHQMTANSILGIGGGQEKEEREFDMFDVKSTPVVNSSKSNDNNSNDSLIKSIIQLLISIVKNTNNLSSIVTLLSQGLKIDIPEKLLTNISSPSAQNIIMNSASDNSSDTNANLMRSLERLAAE